MSDADLLTFDQVWTWVRDDYAYVPPKSSGQWPHMKRSARNMAKAGVTRTDLEESLAAVAEARGINWGVEVSRWHYFSGCVWKRIKARKAPE